MQHGQADVTRYPRYSLVFCPGVSRQCPRAHEGYNHLRHTLHVLLDMTLPMAYSLYLGELPWQSDSVTMHA